jgi:hypothetical protein
VTAGGFCAGLVELVNRVETKNKDRKKEEAREEAPEPRKEEKED